MNVNIAQKLNKNVFTCVCSFCIFSMCLAKQTISYTSAPVKVRMLLFYRLRLSFLKKKKKIIEKSSIRFILIVIEK